MQLLLFIIAIGSSFAALMIFCQSMNNAFNKSFLWGMAFLFLFPVGNYFYYKKFFAEEKNNAIRLTACIATAILTAGLGKLLG